MERERDEKKGVHWREREGRYRGGQIGQVEKRETERKERMREGAPARSALSG